DGAHRWERATPVALMASRRAKEDAPLEGRAPSKDMTRARLFNDVLLSVEGISLSLGGVKALTDISFDIIKGEIRAIIGPNGAGKSSMLNVINGFYHPDHGAIAFKGLTRA